MKQAVILHGTDSSPEMGWFPWLKAELAISGYQAWVPELPNAHAPNAAAYTRFLLGSGHNFQDNLLIGHSSGAVEILHLLQSLPPGVTIGPAVLVGAFTKKQIELPEWSQLTGLFDEPFDYASIRRRAASLLFVHGDNDPWCDVEQAKWLAAELDSELVIVPGGQHFSYNLDPTYVAFPQLVTILAEHGLL